MIRFLKAVNRLSSVVKTVPNHKAPYTADSPAGRYATALFSSASKK